MRLRLDLAYDGTDFSGWATQPDRRTVQHELERWIGQVLRLPEQPGLVVAGRTDAGVHATGQVCHLDLPDGLAVPVRDGERTDIPQLLGHRLGRVLPDDIVVHAIRVVPEDFDARFSALWRRYTYRLWDDRTHREPALRRRAATVRGTLDVDAMNHAAELLLGLQDFAAFCKPREGATTIRTLQRLEAVREDPSGEVVFTVVADAFCHSMVRSLMGAMTAIGQARDGRDEHWLGRLLQATRRDSSVLMMPASGLTLSEVGYPADDQLAARAAEARRRRDEPDPDDHLGGETP